MELFGDGEDLLDDEGEFSGTLLVQAVACNHSDELSYTLAVGNHIFGCGDKRLFVLDRKRTIEG